MTKQSFKRALIIGASGGVGKAIATLLEEHDCEVVTLSRKDDSFDLRNESSILNAAENLTGYFDLIFIATGILEVDNNSPEKTIKTLDPKILAEQFAVNATGPALVLKHFMKFLPRDETSVFAVLSARVSSIGDNKLGGWYSYRASKAALNQLIHTGAIEVARSHPSAICVTLHPGTVKTNFTRNYQNHPSIPPQTAAKKLLNVVSALTPADNGKFFDNDGENIDW